MSNGKQQANNDFIKNYRRHKKKKLASLYVVDSHFLLTDIVWGCSTRNLEVLGVFRSHGLSAFGAVHYLRRKRPLNPSRRIDFRYFMKS